jgi:hypothetical protein
MEPKRYFFQHPTEGQGQPFVWKKPSEGTWVSPLAPVYRQTIGERNGHGSSAVVKSRTQNEKQTAYMNRACIILTEKHQDALDFFAESGSAACRKGVFLAA